MGSSFDYLVCGVCQQDFPLANFPQFMQHKKFDCDDTVLHKVFICKSCPRKFMTPWKLLKHAQNVHALGIYMEKPCGRTQEFSFTITDPFQRQTDTQLGVYTEQMEQPAAVQGQGQHGSRDGVTQQRSTANNDKRNKEDKQRNMESEGGLHKQQSEDVAQDLKDEPEEGEEDEEDNDSVHTLYIADVDCVEEPERQPADKTGGQEPAGGSRGGSADGEQEEGGEEAQGKAACCSRKDCGVTVMPGTHENLKKCCSAVVPKKRKRHMETKHPSGRGKKKGGTKMSEGSTIYIDLEPTLGDISQEVEDESPRSMSPVSFSTADGHMNARTQASLPSKGTVIIQPGSSFSIPVYAISGPLFSQQSSLQLQKPTLVASAPSATQEPGPSKADQGCLQQQPAIQAVSQPSVASAASMGTLDDIMQAAHTLSQLQHQPTQILQQPEEGVSVSELLATEQQLMVKQQQEKSGASYDGDDALTPSRKKRKYPTSRPFKCDQCDHSFNQRIHLKKHQSKHTGIKPYKCEQCDYSTVERSHLKVHIRVHTGEKPFKCTYCEYATAQNSTLKIHLKRHHSKGGIQCTVCHKAFPQQQELKQHLQEHQQPPQGIEASPEQSQSLPSGSKQPAAEDTVQNQQTSTALQLAPLLAQLANTAAEQPMQLTATASRLLPIIQQGLQPQSQAVSVPQQQQQTSQQATQPSSGTAQLLQPVLQPAVPAMTPITQPVQPMLEGTQSPAQPVQSALQQLTQQPASASQPVLQPLLTVDQPLPATQPLPAIILPQPPMTGDQATATSQPQGTSDLRQALLAGSFVIQSASSSQEAESKEGRS